MTIRTDPMEIGRRLANLRGGQTQSEVAKEIGVCVSAINNYENGVRIPRDDIKIRLAKYFGVTVESIFFT